MSDNEFVPQDLPETGQAADGSRPQSHARAYATPSPLKAGLARRCPRCGQGKLYGSLLAVKDECEVCGLDYSMVDSGDGPAVFVIFILGFIVMLGVFIVDSVFAPPYWAHALIWGPVIIFGSIALLSPFKATLIALQYANKAREGRLHKEDEDA